MLSSDIGTFGANQIPTHRFPSKQIKFLHIPTHMFSISVSNEIVREGTILLLRLCFGGYNYNCAGGVGGVVFTSASLVAGGDSSQSGQGSRRNSAGRGTFVYS